MRTVQWLALASVLISSCEGSGARDVGGAAPVERGEAPRNGGEAPRPALFAVPIDGMPAIGPPDALVTVVELVDYDCPYSAKAERTMQALRQKYGPDLRTVIVQHPLPIHAHARSAALAALAADDTAFEALHALMFEKRAARSPAELVGLAVEAGSDRGRFERALASGAPEEALARAEAIAAALRVRGTPVFFVNGRKIAGAQPFETFDATVAEELAHARALLSSGVARARVYDAILAEARARPARYEPEEPDRPVYVAEARTAGGSHLAGRADAPTTIVVFVDLECPYSRRLDARLRELTKRRSDVRVVVRHKPLPFHEHARLAARAAVAAEAQGKLAAFTSAVFAHQDALDRASLEAYAAEAGLDLARFARDLDAPATHERLAADEALAERLGVRGTPTSFVEGVRVLGAQPIEAFEGAMR